MGNKSNKIPQLKQLSQQVVRQEPQKQSEIILLKIPDQPLDQSKASNEQQMKKFIRTCELKSLSFRQMYQIYKKYALHPCFQNTLKSAMVLIFLPAMTNLYYTVRPNSVIAPIMPFFIPFVAVVQYLVVFNQDMQKFCFNQNFEEDAKFLREKYQILYLYSHTSKKAESLIQDFRKYQQSTQKVN